MSGRRKINRRKFLIAYDGRAFFLRSVVSTMDDQIAGMFRYTCDQHLGGPFSSITQALQHAKKRGYQTAVPKRSVRP